MTGHRQATARRGTLGRELGHHEVPAGADRKARCRGVGLLVRLVGEKVKHRSVVPQLDLVRKADIADICAQHLDDRCAAGESAAKLIEGRLRDVDGDDGRVTVVNKLADQR